MKLPAVVVKVMLFLLCTLQAEFVAAAHLMGGEVIYEYLGDGTYQITVIQYSCLLYTSDAADE